MDKFKNLISMAGPKTTATSAKEGRLKVSVSGEEKKKRKNILKNRVRRVL